MNQFEKLKGAEGDWRLEEAFKSLEESIGRIPTYTKSANSNLKLGNFEEGGKGGLTGGTGYGRSIQEIHDHSWRALGGGPNGFGYPNRSYLGGKDTLLGWRR